jgi:hypothetical protein
MFPGWPKGAYSPGQVQWRGSPVPGTQVASARSRVRSVRARGSFPRWRSDMAASVGPAQGGAGMDQTLTAQGQVAEGGTGAGRASASGASDGVNGNKPQLRARKCWRRTRGGSASMHFIFEIELGVLYVLAAGFGRCRTDAQQRLALRQQFL